MTNPHRTYAVTRASILGRLRLWMPEASDALRGYAADGLLASLNAPDADAQRRAEHHLVQIWQDPPEQAPAYEHAGPTGFGELREHFCHDAATW